MERVEKVRYYKDSYGELYVRIKVPDFQDNLDSSGKTFLSLQLLVP